MSKGQKFIVKMAVTALLVAVTAVLNRFGSIVTPELKIGFSFVPIMVCGMMFGPLWGGICAGLGDTLAAILIPVGPPHPGITLTAVLSGVIYGLLGLAAARVDSKAIFAGLAVLAVAGEKMLCTLLINSFWISQLTGIPYGAQMAARLPQAVVLLLPELALAVTAKLFIIPQVRKIMK
jgi:ECF transporter S component (folate family)